MKLTRSAVNRTVISLLEVGAKRATVYLSPTLVVSAQRKSWSNKVTRRDRRAEISLKIGQPNYLERRFIQQCKKAGEPFPVRKLQLKFFPKRKAA